MFPQQPESFASRLGTWPRDPGTSTHEVVTYLFWNRESHPSSEGRGSWFSFD